MIRDLINKHQKYSKSGFRYRGLNASRIENLTDTVFGFAITLLVIASQVPKSYVELQASMYEFVGFVACVLLLFGIWNNHNNFFKHYGLQDNVTKSLNFLFLFVLLFYIYPLKYLFSFLGSVILINLLMYFDFSSPALILARDKTIMANMDAEQWADLMVRFGLGLFFIYLIIGLMHINALKKKELLELNAIEIFDTKGFIWAFFYLILTACVSILVVMIGGGTFSLYSGLCYLTIPIALPLIRKFRNKKFKSKPDEILLNND